MIKTQHILYKKKLSYSVWEYLLKLSAVGLFSLFVFILLSSKTDAFNSFVWSSFSFLLITIFSTSILLKNNKWIVLFATAYLLKLIIGTVHYLYFIDPLYFDNSGDYKALTYEFEAVFSQIIDSAHSKLENGICYYEYILNGVAHQEILSFISIPFVYFGDYVLTITPLNSFFSLLISINILLISKYSFNFSDRKLKIIALVTAFFPITLIASLLWRDVIGFAVMSIGLTLIYLAKTKRTQYLMLIIALYLFYLQRTIYPILLLLAFVINIVFNQNNQSRKIKSLSRILTIIFTIILLPFINSLAATEANESMASGIFNFSILMLPIKLLLGLIGPFPWNNFLLYNTIPAYSYQLQDYLQGVFNVAFVICIIVYRKKLIVKKNLNMLNLIGFLIIVSGLFNSYMHMSYVAFGFLFLIPWLYTEISLATFRKFYIYTFLALVILNLIIVLFIGNVGISSAWK